MSTILVTGGAAFYAGGLGALCGVELHRTLAQRSRPPGPPTPAPRRPAAMTGF